ncbi:MarR family winged helix-turn-helix transcriptional regulator [Sneathiella sp.]|uniref:MarR family winged helix-turn-helix transcriptional regulator n=1 Tax=Sneathiella sp. TaxID=1964365 RepID=UPI002612E73E|nr:MarR family transcriptional regulator [Sneathiella sp.]MDF2366723.1 MarR family transcriptional regulator [Sneathiella sp.]
MKLPEESLGFLVNDVSRLMRRNYNRRAQGLGLSLAQWRALAFLARQEGVKQVTLADSLEVQPITLARLIDRLEEAGLVTRRPDPDDRRAIRLYLTPKAQPLLDQMWALAAKTHEDALKDLSEEARAVLIKSLLQAKQSLLSAENRLCGEDAEKAERNDNVSKRT